MIKDEFHINNIHGRYVPSKEPYTYHLNLPDKKLMAFTERTKGEAYNAAVVWCKEHTEFIKYPFKGSGKPKPVYFKEDELELLVEYLPDIPNLKTIITRIKRKLKRLKTN